MRSNTKVVMRSNTKVVMRSNTKVVMRSNTKVVMQNLYINKAQNLKRSGLFCIELRSIWGKRFQQNSKACMASVGLIYFLEMSNRLRREIQNWSKV